MDLGLAGRSALVTGASRGLGEAITRVLCGEGVRVFATGRDTGRLAELWEACPNVVTSTCDLRDTNAARQLPRRAHEALGSLDIVVNNAGTVPRGPFVEASPGEIDEMFAINLAAPLAIAQAAGVIFLPQGRGCLINIASTAGRRGAPGLAAYSASKGAIVRLTEALAREWAGRGVRVNAIAPGAFATDAQPYPLTDGARRAGREASIPAGRLGRPVEVAALTAFLASDLSAFTTGSTVVIDGGETV